MQACMSVHLRVGVGMTWLSGPYRDHIATVSDATPSGHYRLLEMTVVSLNKTAVVRLLSLCVPLKQMRWRTVRLNTLNALTSRGHLCDCNPE